MTLDPYFDNDFKLMIQKGFNYHSYIKEFKLLYEEFKLHISRS